MRGKTCLGFAGCVLLVPSLASATVIVTLVKAGTTQTSDIVTRGPVPGSYNLDLVISSTSSLGSWDGGLQASPPGFFRLTKVTVGAPWTSSDWDWASMNGVSQIGPLDPVSNSLGRFKPDFPDYPPGTYRVVTLTIDISLAPNGEYTFTLGQTTNHGATDPYRYWSNASMVNPPSRDFDSITPFTLNIIPEPATIWLLLGALLLLRRRAGQV